MPVFTATSAYIAAQLGVTSALGIATINFGVRVVATQMITKLIGNTNDTPNNSPVAYGNRVTLPPSTDNKLPVVYGTAVIGGSIVDAKMSTDQKTMWYVMALCETTDTGTFTFDRAWWGDKELIFGDPTDLARVTSWINSNDEENTNVNDNMWVYYFSNGSSNPANGSQTAIQILQNAMIDPTEQWTSNNTMTNCVFAIVRIDYTQNANLVGLEQFRVKVNNTLTKPGEVLYDYFTNERYGCAIPISQVDTDALDALDTYSDQTITYTPVGGGSATQARYRINGPINTNNTCLVNLQQIIDSCDSWLQWNEAENKWSVIINQSYLDYTTFNALFIIDSSNMIGGIDVTPVDLNNTYNSVEAQFPNYKIKDQTDYAYVTLDPADRSPNEPDNQLVVQYPLVNNSVQAEYLATRRLIQSREDLFITVTTDYSGIQVEAGDVIRVQHEVYGWGPLPADPNNPDKLFRVNQVIEVKNEDGSLGAQISMFEYSEQVYQNINISDYTPVTNTGIPYPGWISSPGTPTVTQTTVAEGDLASLIVSATVPATGTVLYMDFYYGTTSDASTHKLYRTVTPATGRKFTNGETVSITVNDLPRGTYYWSVKARGSTTAGGGESTSPSSEPSVWDAIKILAPAVIAGQLLGGLFTDMFRPETVQDIRGKSLIEGFQPDPIPVPVQSDFSTVNFAILLPGTTPGANDIFPWYQGTFTGSLGPWEPFSAAPWLVPNGGYGWYACLEIDLLNQEIDIGEEFNTAITLYAMSDTANTYIQIAPYLRLNGGTDIAVQEVLLNTLHIPLAEPHPFAISLVNRSILNFSPSSVRYSGVAVRNITGGSTATLFSGQQVFSWQKTIT